MEPRKRLYPAVETYMLLSICVLDCLFSAWLISTERAVEGNPVMLFYLGGGLWTLVGARLFIAVLALFIIEWARMRRPRFAHGMLRFAIVAYLGIYVITCASTGLRASDEPSMHPSVALQQDIGSYGHDGPAAYCSLPQ